MGGKEQTDKAVKHVERLNDRLRTVAAADKEHTGLVSNRQLPFLANRSTLTDARGNRVLNTYKYVQIIYLKDNEDKPMCVGKIIDSNPTTSEQ